MKIVKIDDLTKVELLSIMHKYFFEVPQRHINEARRNTLISEGNMVMAKAQEKMDANIGGGIENIKRFQEASKDFDKGMALMDKASLLFEESNHE